MSQEKIEKIKSFLDKYEPNYPIPTLKSFFGENIPEGDFCWDDADAGDWEAEYDDNEWSVSAYLVKVGRNEGSLWIDVMSGDLGGNWDVCCSYDEKEDGDFSLVAHEFKYFCSTEDYFLGWAKYWIDCAVTNQDPLHQYLCPGSESDHQSKIKDGTWPDFCIKSACENISYLDDGGKEFLNSL